MLLLAAVFPSGPRAERTGSAIRIGVLNDAWAANHPAVDGLKAGLRELGFEEGRNVTYDVRLTFGTAEGMAAAARDLVRQGAGVIFTSGDMATLAARAATQKVPIVFTIVDDPVTAGFVESLTHPAGNVTGVSNLATELLPKRVEALKALAPQVHRVWMIESTARSAGTAVKRAAEIGSKLGVDIAVHLVRASQDLDQLFATLRPGDGLLIPDVATMDLPAVLLQTSLTRRIPAVFPSELWVSHGGLISYGADYRAQGGAAARLVAKILDGVPPGDVPVEPADPVVLSVNLKTAKAFGLTAPRQILFRADVIRR